MATPAVTYMEYTTTHQLTVLLAFDLGINTGKLAFIASVAPAFRWVAQPSTAGNKP
jgi:hypothetical protein